MNMDTIFFILFVSYLPMTSVTAVDCGASQSVQFVTMPTEDTITLSDLDNYLEGHDMVRMYVALTEPLLFNPDENFFTTIEKIGGSSTYKRSAFVDNVNGNRCDSYEWTLKPRSCRQQSNSALFKFESRMKDYVIGYYSRCPAMYHLEIVCGDYKEEKCQLNDTIISVFLHDGMNDLSLYDIIIELFEITGVKFGAQQFRWFFTFGESILCGRK